MRTRAIKLIFTIAISCILLSCKREPYDPRNYDSFLYKSSGPIIPPASYVVSADVNGTHQNTSSGKATVSGNGDTLTIEGTFGTSSIQLKVFHFDDLNTTVFLVGGSNPSSARYDTSGVLYDASMWGGGKITRTGLDTKNHQIEGDFDLVLYDSNGDSLKITNGYFKINYSPYYAFWQESFTPYVADSFSAVGLGTNQYTVVLYDTKSKTGIKMILPTTSSGSNSTIYLGQEAGGLPLAYYIDKGGNLIDAAGGEGDFSLPILSNSGIVYGTFGTLTPVHDASFTKFSFSGGNYSVQLEK